MNYSWKLKYKNNNSVWSTINNISNPTNDITVNLKSNRNSTRLYNGSIGRTIPTTKANYENVELSWSFLSSANLLLKDGVGTSGLSLRTIMSAGYQVAFVTHTLYSGVATVSQTFTGYLTEVPKVYLLGAYPSDRGNETFYDLSCQLDIVSIA